MTHYTIIIKKQHNKEYSKTIKELNEIVNKVLNGMNHQDYILQIETHDNQIVFIVNIKVYKYGVRIIKKYHKILEKIEGIEYNIGINERFIIGKPQIIISSTLPVYNFTVKEIEQPFLIKTNNKYKTYKHFEDIIFHLKILHSLQVLDTSKLKPNHSLICDDVNKYPEYIIKIISE